MATLSDSAWANWEKAGRGDFMKAIKSLLGPESSNASLVDLPRIGDLKLAVHELLWKCLRGHVKREPAIQTIGELTTLHEEMGSVVVDSFAIIDVEVSMIASEKEKEEVRERMLKVLKDCERYLSVDALKERMEIETLGDAGIIKNSKKFFSTVIKTKTKLFYKQQKFNLFREECEGYGKLITELNQDLSSTRPVDILKVIKSVIGYFNLDPNRVLDIILESFECQLEHHQFFIQLLQLFTPDANTMNELLGFKFKFYMTEEGKGEVPESLYRQTALMIQHGILDFDTIYSLLGPTDEDILKMTEKDVADAKEFVRKMNIVSTSQDSNKKDDDVVILEQDEPSVACNQKFGLLKALIDVGAWEQAEMLISRLPPYCAVAQPQIARSLARLLHVTMAPVHEQETHRHLGSRIRTKKYSALTNKNAPKQARTLQEFKDIVVPMLLTLGPYAHHDAILLFKVLRICKASLNVATDKPIKDLDKGIPNPADPSVSCLYYDILTIMDEVMLPAVSLMESPNCCLAEEIWCILRLYPYHMRYRLYGQWKSETLNQHPLLLRKKAVLQKSIKRIMQRISKENVKPTSRSLGKLSHSQPGLMFEYVLSQIQLYDNLIGPVVDSLKYLTNLSFDVLGYSIIEALNNPEKDRTKHDGTSISLWLQSLSNFCGAVFKKHTIELTGILQYVANQLKFKKSLDLLILKEVVLKMSGIEAAEEMTDEQIDATAGGELLRQEAGSFNQVKNTKKSSQRLKDALIDNNLAVPLCLLMAQQRNCVVYQETENSHLKLVGNLFDQCQDTLVQFGQFLATNLSIDDYTHRLPPMGQLLTLYHVNSDLAFFLARPMFNHQISLKCEDIRRQDVKAWKAKSESERNDLYVQAATEVMEPVIAAVRPLHPSKVWDDISPQFLTTFWSLTMYDLFVPDAVYDKEIAKLKAAPAKVDENKDLNASRRKKEKERLASLMDKMVDEQRKQRDHVERVMSRLRAEKDNWFISRSAKLAKNETITTFLQLCLFPRCIFTAIDAIYCAKFVQVIHMLKTPNFSTLICFDRIFCDITYTVTSCTENEAHRYGRFLYAMLAIVMRWHKTKEVFEKECVGYPGFVTKFRVATNESKAGDVKNDRNDHVDYENYRHVVHKWHFKIAKALVVCLESKDYVQIRNALTILTKILPYFPMIVNLTSVIEKRIEKVCADEKEARKDLYIKAMSYSGQLRARKPSMLKEHEFHICKTKPEAATPTGTSTTKADDSAKKSSSNSNSKDSSDRSTKSKERDASSRSASREKSVSKSDRAKSEDRRSRRDKESRERGSSKERKRDRESSDHASGKDRRDMGPPSSVSSHRRSVEPSEERDQKRKKSSDDDSSDKRSKREKSEPASHSSSSPGNKKDKDKKVDRKRERSEESKEASPSAGEKRRRGGDVSSKLITSPDYEDSSRHQNGENRKAKSKAKK